MKTLKNIIPVITFIIISFISNSSFGKSFTWTGSTDTCWNKNTNWNPNNNGFPTNNDTVTIGTTANHPSLDTTRIVYRLIMSADTLNLCGYTLTSSNYFSMSGGIISSGSLITNGERASFGGGTLNVTITGSANRVFIGGSTFNYQVALENTGTATSEGAGGSTFNAKVSITKTSASTGNFSISNSSGNTFNDTAIFINNSSGDFVASNLGNTYFNGDIYVGASSVGGIKIGNSSSGTSTLASGKKLKVNSGGFIGGPLELNYFTQVGSTAQSLTLTNIAVINCYKSVFNGNISFTAPGILLKHTIFNGIDSLTQTGSTGTSSYGGNTFNAASVFHCTGNHFKFAVNAGDTLNGDVTISGTVDFITYTASILKGNFYVGSGVHFTHLSSFDGTAVFAGSNSQVIEGIGRTINMNKIKIDKTGGSVSLDTTVSINDTLFLVNKNLITTSSHLLSMLAGSVVTGASNSSFVSGPILKTGNTAFVFPTGKGSDYRAIEISAPASGTYAYTGEYFDSGQSLGTSMDGTMKYIHNCGYWNLARNVGSSNVTVTLNWDSAACDLLDSTTLKVANWNGSTWKDLGNGGVTGNKYVGKVANSTTVITWGNFTLAYDKCFLTTSAGSDQAFCASDSVTVGGSPVAGGLGTGSYTYSWSPSTALSSTSIANPKASPGSTTDYIVTVTDVAGCSAKDTVTVTYRARPTASAGADKSLCDGSTVTIGGSPTASGGTSPYTYSWSPSTALSSSTSANPDATPSSTTNYIVTVTDANGCTKKDTVAVNNGTITYTWTGATSSDWSTSSNWSPAGVPDSCDNVIIVSGSHNTVLNSTTPYLNSLTINSGTLDIDGNNLIINRKAIFNSGTLLNHSIFIFSADTVSFNGTHIGDGFISAAAKTVLLNGSVFDGIVDLYQTGTSNSYSAGGNVFNSSFAIENSGSGSMYFETASADIFNDYAGFTNSGAGYIYPSYTKNTTFNSYLYSGGHVVFGLNGGKAIIAGNGDPVTGNHDLYADTLTLFKKFEINKTNDDLTLYGRLTIGDSLILTKGKIITDSLVIMNAGSVVSGASDNSFVAGPVKKIGSTAFVFPVGKGNYYRAIEMSAPSSGTDAFTAEYFDTTQTLGDSMETTIKFISGCDYWMLLRNNGSSNVTIKLNWNSASCQLRDSATVKVANWDGIKWKDLGNGGITGNYTNGKVVNSTTVATYGYFTLSYVVIPIIVNLGTPHTIEYDFFGLNGQNVLHPGGSWLNSDLQNQLSDFQPSVLRYAGGTLGNWFNWTDGWFFDRSDIDPCFTTPENYHGFFLTYGPSGSNDVINTIDNYRHSANRTHASTFNTLNCMTSDINTQVARLFAEREANIPLDYVEIGNEFYNPECEHVQKYQTPGDYAADANSWNSDLKAHVGSSLNVAAVGALPNSLASNREAGWNNGAIPLLDVGSTGIQAIVLHAYSGSGLSTLTMGNINLMLKQPWRAFENPLGLRHTITVDINNSNFDYWITEYGLFDRGKVVHGSWAHGLFEAHLTLKLLELEDITHALNHAMTGDHVFGNIFDDDQGFKTDGEFFDPVMDNTLDYPLTTPHTYTAKGLALKMLTKAMKNSNQATPLEIVSSDNLGTVPGYPGNIYGDPITVPAHYGWLFQNTNTGASQVIILNLTDNTQDYNLSSFGINFTGAESIDGGLNGPVGFVYNDGTNYVWFEHCPTCAPGFTPTGTMNFTSPTVSANTVLSVQPYSITRIYNCPTSLSIQAATNPVCNGLTTSLFVNGTPDLTYNWSTGATSSSIEAGQGTYSVSVSGCLTNSYSITVTAAAAQTISFTPTSLSVCPNGTNNHVTVTALLSGGGTKKYAWITNDGFIDQVTDGLSASLEIEPEQTTTYTVYATDGACATHADYTVTVSPKITLEDDHTVCIGKQYTFNILNPLSGGIYSWAGPSGFTAGNVQQPTLTPSSYANSGIYTVTYTTGGSCTSTDEINLTAVNCCAETHHFPALTDIDDIATYIDNNTLGTVTITSDETHIEDVSVDIEFEGELIINKDVYFKNCSSLKFDEAAKITIQPYGELHINGCNLSNCTGYQWKGIETKRFGDFYSGLYTSVETNVSGAQYAIQSNNGSLASIKYSNFNDNYVGLYIPPVDPNNFQYINEINLTVDQDDFYGTGSLPTLYTGQTPTPLTKSFAGILFNDVAGSIENTGGSFNIFDELNNGIIGINSSLLVSNSQFNNINWYDWYPWDHERGNGVGIFVAADPFAYASLTQTGLGASSVTATFDGCYHGIYSNNASISSSDNKMISMGSCYSANNNTLSQIDIHDNDMEITGITAPTQYNSGSGFSLHHNGATQLVRIKSNIITSINTSFNPYAAINAWDVAPAVIPTRTYGINCNIVSGNFMLPIVGGFLQTGSATNFINNDISMEANAYAGMYLIGSDGATIIGNSIEGAGATNGIAYSVNLSPNLTFETNSSDLTEVGFDFLGACTNSILKTNTFGITNFGHDIGLHLRPSSVIGQQFLPTFPVTVFDNEWIADVGATCQYGSNYGAINDNSSVGSSIASQFRYDDINSIGSAEFPRFLAADGGPFFVSETSPNHSSPQSINCSSLFTGNESELKTLDEIIALDSLHTSDFDNEVRFMAASDLYDKLSKNESLLADQLYRDFFDAMEVETVGQLSAMRSAERAIYEDDLGITGQILLNDSTIRVYLMQKAYNDSLLEADGENEILETENKSLMKSVSILILQTNKLLSEFRENSLSKINTAIDLNDAVDATEIIEINERNVNDVYLHTIVLGNYDLSDGQIDTLTDVASQCPLSGGRSVYQARGILKLLGDSTDYNDDSLCSSYSPRMLSTKTNPIEQSYYSMVYPNPSNGNFYLYSNLPNDNDAFLIIFDNFGKEVCQSRISETLPYHQMKLATLSNGIYQYKILVGKKQITQGKITIIK